MVRRRAARSHAARARGPSEGQGVVVARIDELRLLARVARLYYGQGLRQSEITDRLNVHQSTVSRLLKRAEKEGIVRISFSMPSGLHPDLEDQLESAFGLREAIVVDA